MHGRTADTGEHADDTPNRLTAKIAGPAIAAGAIALGLVIIGACGLGHHDTYVAPPPLSANLPAAAGTRAATSTTQDVYIPPSPSWRVAANTPPRRTPTAPPSSSTTQYPGYTYDPYTTPPQYYEPNYATPAYTPPQPTTTDDPFGTDDTTTPAQPTETPYTPNRLPSEQGDN